MYSSFEVFGFAYGDKKEVEEKMRLLHSNQSEIGFSKSPLSDNLYEVFEYSGTSDIGGEQDYLKAYVKKMGFQALESSFVTFFDEPGSRIVDPVSFGEMEKLAGKDIYKKVEEEIEAFKDQIYEQAEEEERRAYEEEE